MWRATKGWGTCSSTCSRPIQECPELWRWQVKLEFFKKCYHGHHGWGHAGIRNPSHNPKHCSQYVGCECLLFSAAVAMAMLFEELWWDGPLSSAVPALHIPDTHPISLPSGAVIQGAQEHCCGKEGARKLPNVGFEQQGVERSSLMKRNFFILWVLKNRIFLIYPLEIQ